jgi:putative DNA primase/helicase
MSTPYSEVRLRDLAQERNPRGQYTPIAGIFDIDARGRTSVNIVRLAAAIEEPTRFRTGPDGSLYRYDSGVYLPDGEEYVRLAAMSMLAGAYRASVVNEVVRFYLDRETANPLSFDPDPGSIIRTASGIIDMKTWHITPYTYENASIVQIPWSLVQGAECPLIDQFLMDCFWNDLALVAYMYRIAGYTMLTRNPLRLAFLLFGPGGNNGKSIYLHLLNHLLGERNVAAVPLQKLGGDDRFSPARLVGRLANICGDIGPKSAQDMSLFKQITGGDRIQAERKFGEPFEFISGATPVFSANEFPASPDTTRAYKGRWQAVEFPRTFAEDGDKEYELKAIGENQSEMEGFMWKAACAAKEMTSRNAFEQPDAVRACTDRFWRSMDSFESFAADKIVLDPQSSTPSTIAYALYKDYCGDNNYKHVLGRNRFYEKLVGMNGVRRDYSDHTNPFIGFRLTEYEGPALVLAEEVAS